MKLFPYIKRSKGFTLLEVLLTVTIVSILIGISIPAYRKFQNRAKRAGCISNIRSVHAAFATAVADLGEWPQVPLSPEGEIPRWDQEQFFDFWFETMIPYGLSTKDVWACPSDIAAVFQLRTPLADSEFYGSYVPTWFSSGANTPFRWNQPWITERSGFHGTGRHIALPDGSVELSTSPFIGR